MVASGGFKFCVSSTSFQKHDIDWPQQPLTEKVLNFNMYFMILPPKNVCLKHKNKPEFKCVDDSEVLSSDFAGLKTSAASLTSVASTASMASMTFTASFHQNNLPILMIWSSLSPKWPIPVSFGGIDHQKSNFLLISDTLPVGGCWGQPISHLWNLVDETQILKPPEATRHH